MKPFIAAFSFILLSLAAGCLEKAQEPGILFVCADGGIVSNSSDCGITKEAYISEPAPTMKAEDKRVSVDYSSSCVQLGCSNETRFIGNKRTMKYHLCYCRYAVNMSKENRACLSGREEAAALNYSACRVCSP